MELTIGSVSVLWIPINENLNCRRSADTVLAQVSRATPVPRVSISRRRPLFFAERSLFLRGGRGSPSWKKLSEDTTGLGCRLCINGPKQADPSHNSRWQARAVAELSGTDVKGIDSSTRDDLPNTDATVYIIKEGDTLTAIAKRYSTTISRLAVDNGIENVDELQVGEKLVVPLLAAGVRKVSSHVQAETPFSTDRVYTVSTANGVRDLSTATTSGYDTPTLSHVGDHSPFPVGILAQVVIPLLLIAPVVGFCVRCVVDYIQDRIEKEIRAKQADMETYRSRHRPKLNRWQGILDEDREEALDYGEAAAASDSLDEYRLKNERQIPTGYASMRAMNEESLANESEEERSSRQLQDYEDIRKSYAELESTYMKFLSDSGLSRSGYWRGSVTQLQEET